jgi:hypothetical protein
MMESKKKDKLYNSEGSRLDLQVPLFGKHWYFSQTSRLGFLDAGTFYSKPKAVTPRYTSKHWTIEPLILVIHIKSTHNLQISYEWTTS